jgi:hypothetical protein
MSTPEAAVADTTVRIGLLMEAVESQRALVSSALEQLQQHTAGLDAIVSLNDERRPAVGRLRSKRLPEIRPPDFAAPGYHLSRRRTSSESASAAGSSFEDVLA